MLEEIDIEIDINVLANISTYIFKLYHQVTHIPRRSEEFNVFESEGKVFIIKRKSMSQN